MIFNSYDAIENHSRLQFKYAIFSANGEDIVSVECRSATVRAYNELRTRGINEVAAFDASVVIYKHYHPGSATDRARDLVAYWIEEDLEERFLAAGGSVISAD